MKRTSRVSYFLSGMLTTLLLISVITPALAAGLSKYIEVSTGVSVYVDDVKLDPRDANGNPVEVFIYNGTTYLPVRAVSEALEVPVQWDGSTRSVYVGKHSGDKPAAWLSQMDYFSGTSSGSINFSTAQSEKDNCGNTHYHCINGYNMDRTYKLNGQYKNITGTIYQKYEYRSYKLPHDAGVWIYGDGELLYCCELGKDETGIDPISFDVDLTGVLEMQVVFDGAKLNQMGAPIALGDVGLWT